MGRASEIYVIDDDEAVRNSLGFLLRSTGFTPYLYASALHFLDECERLRPACVITDVRMPGMTGLELVRRLQELGLPHPVIVVTGHSTVRMAVDAMKAGACDFLEKPIDEARLLKALLAAQNWTGHAASQTREQDRAIDLIAMLSPREQHILQLVVTGKANKVMAQVLGISPRTVEIHRANLMRKLGASSLSELVRVALAGGLDLTGR